MTTLEQAARQALETLERASDAGYSVECDETITALREALEQAAPKAAPGELIEIERAIRAVGLTLVKTTNGYSLLKLGKVEAQVEQPSSLQVKRDEWDSLPLGAHRLLIAATKAAPKQEAQEPCGWDGAEEWEKLAWHLCAEENGEDACNDLIWEGGPMPEPWGDRWLKYGGEARRMIALVRTHVPAPQPAPAPLSDDTTLLDFIEQHPEMFLRHRKGRWAFAGFTNYEIELMPTLRDALRAAMAAQGGKV